MLLTRDRDVAFWPAWEGRQTLIALMANMNSSKNPVKQAGAW
jgi:hypothetical protein